MQAFRTTATRSDNGSGYISREFREVMASNQLSHARIKPHCPEENGLVERCNRTLREALENHSMENRVEAEKIIRKIIRWYNKDKVPPGLGICHPPGLAKTIQEERRLKLAAARRRRKERHLRLSQVILPLIHQN
jgi:putative transposase